MEEIFTSHPDNCTSDPNGNPTSDILQISSTKDTDASGEMKLKYLLDQQLVEPRQESIDKILHFSKSL